MAYSSENSAHMLKPVVDNRDKQPAQGSAIMLPPELSTLVCGFLPKPVLKQVRQVSKSWERAAVPYLFDQIFMSLNVADLRIANLVILQFKQYICTLVFSSVCYTAMDRKSFDERFDFDKEFDSDDLTDLTDTSNTDHAFEFYRIARRNQRDNLKSDLFSAYLAFVLTRLPNIRKVVLTDTAAFSMSPERLDQAKICSYTLTKIRFSLIVDSEQFSTDVEIRHVHQNVTKLLRSAANIESLSLDLNYHEGAGHELEHSTLQETIGRCKFPKLRSLILAFFSSSEAELLRLLKHSRNLEQITLSCHYLSKGSWMRVADWIRASLPLLRHVELNQLYCGFDEHWEEIEYMDVYKNVGAFFFAQGENPFTTRALAKYSADNEAKRQKIDPFRGIGHVETYSKYH